jgi:Ohr subfamily peroxiredoxin
LKPEHARSFAAMSIMCFQEVLPTRFLQGAAMAKILYTAKAHVTGGREGHGRTTDGQLDVDLRLPAEMGGPGGGTNPEELFAVGYAACFESALMNVARRRHLDAGDVQIDSKVSLLPNGEGGFVLAVVLDVTLTKVADRGEAVALVEEAHQVCPYSNATRGNIDVELLVEGEALHAA